MSEKAESCEDMPDIDQLNVIGNENNQETADNNSPHKSKKKKKKKQKDRYKIIESDEDRTRLEPHTGPSNGHIAEDASTRPRNKHPSSNVDTGPSNGHPDQAAAPTRNEESVRLETEITKTEINEVKTRRGHRKHRAEDKSNEYKEQAVESGHLDERLKGSGASGHLEERLKGSGASGHLEEQLKGSGASHMTMEDNASEHSQRNVEKWEKKLDKKKQEYQEEKNNLKQKLQETKTRFEEEIKKYETDLNDKRQEYLSQLTNLQFDEQMQSMAKRMEELTELEDELDRRFKQCVDFEMEIEQAEKYLDRRSEICKSREEELKNLDEELDVLHQELQLDKERLQMSGVNVNTILASKRGERFNQFNSSFQSPSGEDDYILKANLRRTQGELKSTKQNLDLTTEKLDNLTDEFNLLQSEKKKSDQKIKHLETQLAVALGQLTQRNLTSGNKTLPKDQDRYKSVHKHITLNRLNEDGLLSINQQAQLRRKESFDRSSSSDGGRFSRQATGHKISRLTNGLEPSTSNSRGSSEGSGSVIGDQVVGSMVSESGSSKSTTCNVM